MNNLFEVKTQKEKRITFRVTSDEFKVLKEKAEDKNLTVLILLPPILNYVLYSIMPIFCQ